MKIESGKSRDYHDATDFKKLRFQDVFFPHESREYPAFQNSVGLKSAFKKRFRDGVGL